MILAQWATEWSDLDTDPIAIVGRFLRIVQYLERDIGRALGRLGLGMSEFNVLAALRRSSPPHQISPADLSRSLIITSGGVVKTIDRLELAGLVRRLPHPTDGRGRLVELTRAGRQVIDESMVVHVENERRLLSPLTTPEREQLAAILRKLLVVLEDRSG